ncbi:hypothetical protein ABS755_01410 [Castellaniella sp. FW104-16D08]|uniref:hypothetical protein n=1 Tax=unclassified Castellaniella TaxID=2617606 RepID=UPI003314BC8D
MKRYVKTLLLGLALAAQTSLAADLKIDSFAPDITELDLFSTGANGAYVRSINPKSLTYPIPILDDRNGSFVIRVNGKKYVIQASGANTNKVFQAKAKGVCPNAINGKMEASTRGITGQGC